MIPALVIEINNRIQREFALIAWRFKIVREEIQTGVLQLVA